MLRAFGSVEPSVDPTCYVDPSAQVIGEVGLGAGVERLDERRDPRGHQPHVEYRKAYRANDV
jgi:hypothetical protein